MDLYEAIVAALYEHGVDLTCESCGTKGWKAGFGELGNLRGLLPGVTPHGETMNTPTAMGGLAVYPLICAHCGFVRLYSLAQLGLQPD